MVNIVSFKLWLISGGLLVSTSAFGENVSFGPVGAPVVVNPPSTATTIPPSVSPTATSLMNGNATAVSGTASLNGTTVQSLGGATSAANQSSSGNNWGSVISSAVGGGMIAYGTPLIYSNCFVPTPNPGQVALCQRGVVVDILGGLALVQGISSSGASDQNNTVANQTAVGEPVTTTSPNSAAKSAALAQLAAVKAALKQAGVNFDTTTGIATLPNGKTISPSDTSNPAAIAAETGMSQSDYKGILAKAAELEKKAIADAQKSGTAYTASNGFDGGSGGAGLNPLDAAADPAAAAAAALAAKRAPANASGKAGVAGMARNYNGDMIGVAGDDIFQMMTRRYQEKVKNQSFLSPEALPTGTAQAMPSLMPKSH